MPVLPPESKTVDLFRLYDSASPDFGLCGIPDFFMEESRPPPNTMGCTPHLMSPLTAGVLLVQQRPV